MADLAATGDPRLPGAGVVPTRPMAVPPAMGAVEAEDTVPTLHHTAVPRWMSVVGLATVMAILAVVGVRAVLDDTDVDLAVLHNPSFLGAIAATLAAGLWWSLAASLNGRRLTRGRTVGPLVAPLCYVLPVAGYVVIRRLELESDVRTWVWVGWLAAGICLHYFVVMSYRSSAEMLGNATTHFTEVATIPIAGFVVAVGAFYLSMLALLAEPVLVAWFVVEIYRAMDGWDRTCRSRVRAAIRERMPSEAVATFAPADLVAHAPERTEKLPVSAVMAAAFGGRPAVADGVDPAAARHPVRPTWNPAEEARQRRDAAVATAIAHGTPLPPDHTPQADRNEFVAAQHVIPRVDTGQVAAVEPAAEPHRHHTMVPRTLCIAAMMICFASPAVLLLLNRAGHLELNSDGTWTYDDTAKRVLVVGLAGAAASYVFGWLWWSTAAAANARHKTRWAMSPWTPVLSFAVMVMAVVAGPYLARDASDGAKFGVAMAVGVAVLIAHFGLLGAFRRTAGAVGANQAPWTRLIVLPWVFAAVNGLGGFFATAVEKPLLLALQLVALLFYGSYAFSMYQAMTSFDRACIGTRLIGQEDDAWKKFLNWQ